jgi:hypothetical protein
MRELIEASNERDALRTKLALLEAELQRLRELFELHNLLPFIAKGKCSCDASVGMAPCEPCAAQEILRKALHPAPAAAALSGEDAALNRTTYIDPRAEYLGVRLVVCGVSFPFGSHVGVYASPADAEKARDAWMQRAARLGLPIGERGEKGESNG